MTARPLNRRIAWRRVWCSCGWTPPLSWAAFYACDSARRHIEAEERQHAKHHAERARTEAA